VAEADTILRVGADGEGVTSDGRRVPLAAPGDRLQSDGILVPGPHHADPPCRHFPECGGCQLQHLDDDAHRAFLTGRVEAALAQQGLRDVQMLTPHLSPPVSRRRASLSVERKGKRVLLGFKAEKTHRIIDMHECFILRTELFALVEPLRALLEPMLGERRTGNVRMTLSDQGADILVEGVRAEGLRTAEALTTFAQTYRLGRLSVDEGYGAETRWEPEPVTISLGGVAVPLPHNAFLQATQDGEKALVEAVKTAVGPAKIVADLFAGLGTFALALGGRVYAAEGDRTAALSLKSAANRAGREVFADVRDLFRNPLDLKELNRFDAVVLDPPRAGAKEQADLLARSAVPGVAYVSCNPATFARDAAKLVAGGYRLAWVRPIGQFRWSTHVELVGAFVR